MPRPALTPAARRRVRRLTAATAAAALACAGPAPLAAAQPAGTPWTAFVPNGTAGGGDVLRITAGATPARGTDMTSTLNSPNQIALTSDGIHGLITNGGQMVPFTTDAAATGTGNALGGPFGDVAISPDGTKAYIVNGGTIKVINPANPTSFTPVATATSPSGIVINPAGTTLYVRDTGTNNIVAVNIASPSDVPVTGLTSTGLADMAFAPSGTILYVVNTAPTPALNLISTASNAVADTFPLVGTTPDQLAITPDGKTAFVTDVVANHILVVNLSTANVGSIDLSGVPGIVRPVDLAVTPDGDTVFVTVQTSGNAVVVPIRGGVVGTPIATNAPEISGIAIMPDQAPVAALSATPPHSPVTFDASASTVPFGTIASYAWNFGDGQTAVTTTPTTTHTYAAPGTYTASVTLTSSGGTSTTQVFTGRMMLRNGAATATTTVTVTVPASAAEAAFMQTVTGARPLVPSLVGVGAIVTGGALLLLARRRARR